MRPKEIHQWRQTDCLSLAYNYYSGGMHFFEPEIHLQFSDNFSSGKTAGEFPGLYFLVAALWKLTGYHEFVYRSTGLLIMYLGLLALFRLLLGLSCNIYFALFFTLLVFTSPVFANYGISFLSDAPALCSSLAGGYIMFCFYRTQKKRWLWTAMFLYLLGGWLKTSSLFSYFIWCTIFAADLFRKKKIFFIARPFTAYPF